MHMYIHCYIYTGTGILRYIYPRYNTCNIIRSQAPQHAHVSQPQKKLRSADGGLARIRQFSAAASYFHKKTHSHFHRQ